MCYVTVTLIIRNYNIDVIDLLDTQFYKR